MKLVNYKMKQRPGQARMGCVVGENVYDLQEAYRQLLLTKQENDLVCKVETLLPADPGVFYALGEEEMNRAKDAAAFIEIGQNFFPHFSRDEVILGNPVPRPSKIICVGKNYADHVAEMQGVPGASALPEFPVLFAKYATALIGPEEKIEKPSATSSLDYEVELAVVIGKHTSKVTRQEALNHIAGYTIANDTTARDLQKRTPQWLQGKSLDRSTPVGPWVVTADEIDDPASLTISSYVNGELRQSSNTKHMIFSISHLIEFISSLITLQPGDLILTGTPDGAGAGMNPPKFLEAGDTVTLEIEQIGRMENSVVSS
ncbi:fumarylacetoacetate hydrolase family protein [Lentibacillus sediminis]|uniref:fumarylacetoacetate hydrolase family protein n=1 Tax=Lentibacillus sediminis TaxID=1940529 RepID=UPI000C1BB9F6|nr:fumarylacetoacetate hydrolase family protein [Lentibacillus sediminis]